MHFISPLSWLFPSSPAQLLVQVKVDNSFLKQRGQYVPGSLGPQAWFPGLTRTWETAPICPQIKSLAPSGQGMSPASLCTWHRHQPGDSPGRDPSHCYRTDKSKGRSITCELWPGEDAEPAAVTLALRAALVLRIQGQNPLQKLQVSCCRRAVVG